MSKKCRKGPAWLATFADLMSLLMALFVLLFAMSTVEIPKYKAVVESLNEALGNGTELSPEQEQFFQSLQKAMGAEANEAEKAVVVQQTVMQDLQPLYESLIETYSEASEDQGVKIQFDSENNQVKLVFSEQIAFDPGRAELKPYFKRLLKRFFVFKHEEVAIQVVGHTDSRPITGGRFRSNWELSSARAASVIEQLVGDGSIRPEQAEAIGLADTQPISQGTTEEDYAKNRRVEVLVTPESFRP